MNKLSVILIFSSFVLIFCSCQKDKSKGLIQFLQQENTNQLAHLVKEREKFLMNSGLFISMNEIDYLISIRRTINTLIGDSRIEADSLDKLIELTQHLNEQPLLKKFTSTDGYPESLKDNYQLLNKERILIEQVKR